MSAQFSIQNKESLHHAYVLEGSFASALPVLERILGDLFGLSMSHPDVFVHQTAAFGVEDAALVVEKNSRRPSAGSNKFIIVSLAGISHQAQNSLLKTLEEPAVGTHIFIIAPTASIFLPTVRSRVHVVSLGRSASQADSEVSANATGSDPESLESLYAEEFVASNHPERLEIVKKVLAEKEKERATDADIVVLVRGIEKRTHALMEKQKLSPEARADALKALVRASEYIYDSSSSKKLLLEYIALALPIFK
ncbi:MAG TPA: hypothetical protein VGE62_00580 [Candidatus Paceibacterota bacterium]